MALYETRVSVVIDTKPQFEIHFKYYEHADGGEDEISLTVHQNNSELTKQSWRITLGDDPKIALALTGAAGPRGACIAGCLSAVFSALVKCLSKAKTRTDVIKCFQQHAPGAILTGAPCVFGCLGI